MDQHETKRIVAHRHRPDSAAPMSIDTDNVFHFRCACGQSGEMAFNQVDALWGYDGVVADLRRRA